MKWAPSHRAHTPARILADRHYNRQKIGAPQFVPPGRCVVLLTECARAVWVTSWPFAQYVKHQWAGAWVNSLFRSEGAGIASELIRQAVAATRAIWPDVPPLGVVSFVDPRKVKPTMRRGKLIYGYCYLRAGFRHVGYTKGGLWAWQLLPQDFPPAQPALALADKAA